MCVCVCVVGGCVCVCVYVCVCVCVCVCVVCVWCRGRGGGGGGLTFLCSITCILPQLETALVQRTNIKIGIVICSGQRTGSSS